VDGSSFSSEAKLRFVALYKDGRLTAEIVGQGEAPRGRPFKTNNLRTMKTFRTNPARLCAVYLAAGVLAFCSGTLYADPGNNPRVLPPNSTPRDLSYPEWHVVCLNWILSIPAEVNPLLQVDDEADLAGPAPHPLWFGTYDASVGQSGNVWILPGAYATVEREAVIPAGKTLCLPMLNKVVLGIPPIPAAQAFYSSYVKLVMDTAVITCEIDGVPVANIEQYRHQSPVVPLTLPENNMLGLPAGPLGYIVDDGYYLILAPLSVGTHTIRWQSTVDLIPLWNPQLGQTQPPPPYDQATQDVTYRITVVPSKMK
jgi:hypothetical protein